MWRAVPAALGMQGMADHLCDEWLDQVLVHPEADVHAGIEAMLRRSEGVSAARIVVQLGVDAHLLESIMIVVSLVRRHPLVGITDQEEGRGLHTVNR